MKNADNPNIYEYFFDLEGNAARNWPLLVLCKDINENTYTWHIGCDNYPLYHWVDPIFRLKLERIVSGIRKRDLNFVEIYTHEGEWCNLDDSD